MTESNSAKSQSVVSRGCLVALIALFAFAVLLVVGIRYVREQHRLSLERYKAELRQMAFDRVKNGDNHAAIMDSKLLPMLASDAECVANLTNLGFAMTEIAAEDAPYISQLKNVEELYFYDTVGVDLVLENAIDLPITKMGFDMARLSEDSLRKLADFPKLSDVRFTHIMSPNEIAILKTLPPRITVDIP